MMKSTSSDKLAYEDCFDRFILHIIPVIDLLNGSVVHAKQGHRANYLPIASQLAASTKPIDIVKAFMTVYAFNTLYIADLNAIQNLENSAQAHKEIIEEIQTAFPKLTLWVDAGINTIEKAKKWDYSNATIILGSESFTSIIEYKTLIAELNTPFVLSLDYLVQGFTGPQDLLASNQYWPENIIVMTLTKVGANTGGDINTISDIRAKATKHHVYAAGGIRNIDDLQALKQQHIHGVLIASALHNKQINTEDLTLFDQ